MARREGPLSPPRPSSLFLFAVFLLLGLLSTGAYMNDEFSQLEGLWNLRQGSFTVVEPAPQFYAIGEDRFGDTVYSDSFAGSPFVNVASLPAYYVLKALDLLGSAAAWLIIGWAVAAYVTLRRGWSKAYTWRTNKQWTWFHREVRGDTRISRWGDTLRAMSVSHWALAVVVAGWALGQIRQLPSIDYGLWGEVFAIQTTHVAFTALAFALFYRWVLKETSSQRAAALMSLAFLISPILFWGMGIKYHASTIGLIVAAGYTYQLESSWRFAAFPLAALAMWNTILAVPILASLLIVELASRAWQAQQSQWQGLPRQVAIAGAVTGAAVGGLLWYNRVVHDNWLGGRGVRDEQLAAAGGLTGVFHELWVWGLRRIRFESLDRSLHNVWTVFVNARGNEGDPLAMLPLTPFLVLAVAAPWIIWKQRRLSRTTAFCMAHTGVFLALAIHGAHIQGDMIADHRYFLTSIPPLLLLAGMAVRDRLEALEKEDLIRAGRSFAIALGVALLMLVVLGTNGVPIVAGEHLRQLINAGWITGTVAWLGLAAFQAFGTQIDHRLGPQANAWWARIAGLSFVAPALWLVMMTLLVTRDIPPYDGGEGMSFLMPSLHEVRMWWGPKLIP